jgi:hypothetical protein
MKLLERLFSSSFSVKKKDTKDEHELTISSPYAVMKNNQRFSATATIPVVVLQHHPQDEDEDGVLPDLHRNMPPPPDSLDILFNNSYDSLCRDLDEFNKSILPAEQFSFSNKHLLSYGSLEFNSTEDPDILAFPLDYDKQDDDREELEHDTRKDKITSKSMPFNYLANQAIPTQLVKKL